MKLIPNEPPEEIPLRVLYDVEQRDTALVDDDLLDTEETSILDDSECKLEHIPRG